MEMFREHEKEFKMKQYSKWGLRANQEKQSNYIDMKSKVQSGSDGEFSDNYDFSDVDSSDEIMFGDEMAYGEESEDEDEELDNLEIIGESDPV